MSSTTTINSVITLSATIRVVAPTEADRGNGVSFKFLDVVEVDGQPVRSELCKGIIDSTGKPWSKINISVIGTENVGTIADAMALPPTKYKDFAKRPPTEAEAADKSII